MKEENEYVIWIIELLKDWRDTFEDDVDEEGEPTTTWEDLNEVIHKLEEQGQPEMTICDYDYILFHLWQTLHYRIKEEGDD